jgi:hypothetical protein
MSSLLLAWMESYFSYSEIIRVGSFFRHSIRFQMCLCAFYMFGFVEIMFVVVAFIERVVYLIM